MRKLTAHDKEAIRYSSGMTPQLLAKELGVSVGTIYRVLSNGGPSRRKDAGRRRFDPEDRHLQEISKLVVTQDFGCDFARLILERNGRDGLPAAGTINRLYREKQITRETVKKDAHRIYRRREAEYPNKVWQMDFTISPQYYIDDDGGVKQESPLSYNKNRPGNQKTRLWLYNIVDDRSRCIYTEYWPGLSTHYVMQFFFNACRQKDDHATFPFMGVPEILFTDNDKVLLSVLFQRALQALDIKHITHLPGHSWAKGKVENSIKKTQEFEKITKLAKFKNIAEANAALFDWLIYINNKKHSVIKCAPFVRFFWESKKKEIRALPESQLTDCLLIQRATLLVDKFLEIALPRCGRMALPRKPPFIEMGGQKVEVSWFPKRPSVIYILWKNKEHEVELSTPTAISLDTPKTVMTSERQKRVERLREVDTSNLKLTGIYGAPYEGLYPIQHKTVEISTPALAAFAGPQRSFFWCITEMQSRKIFSVPVKLPERAALLAFFGERETVSDSDFNAWVESGELRVESQGLPMANSQEAMG